MFLPISEVRTYVFGGPAGGGGGPMSPVWILTRLVLVFVNVCRLLSALPWPSQFGRGKLSLDCLQSAFSLKIRLVLISSSAIPNHDVIITGARGLGFACSNLAKKTRDCSQSRSSLVAISFHALLLLFGPCRLSEFTLSGPLFSWGTLRPSYTLNFLVVFTLEPK